MVRQGPPVAGGWLYSGKSPANLKSKTEKKGETETMNTRRKWLAIALVVALVLPALAASVTFASSDWTSGYQYTATIKAVLKYRHLFQPGKNGFEGLLGPCFVGESGCSISYFNAQGGKIWDYYGTTPYAATNHVTLTYDGTNTFTVRIDPDGAAGPFTMVYTTATAPGDLNYLQLDLRGQVAGTVNEIVSFNNGKLGGASLSDVTGTNTWSNWYIMGVDLTGGFTLEGDMVLTWPLSNTGCDECNKLQLKVGYVVPPDNEGPVTSNVEVSPSPACLNGATTVTATVDDTTTGGSNIAYGEYSLNGGDWTAMAASDGAFDGVTEDVTADFTASTVGDNEVCVRGTDSLGNVGAPICQDFSVHYVFDGFYSPIDMGGVVNLAKAGQAVPAKWRLTDCNGVPIADPASFVGLYSYPVSCTDFIGDPTASVEEYAPGSSGLQYNGDGYWQFNWKTLKTYAGTCRLMYVEFDSIQISPVAYFQFK